MMVACLLERPVNEIFDIGENERLCDSTRVDNRVPFIRATAPTARIRSAPWQTAPTPCIASRGMALRLEQEDQQTSLPKSFTHPAVVRQLPKRIYRRHHDENLDPVRRPRVIAAAAVLAGLATSIAGRSGNDSNTPPSRVGCAKPAVVA